MLGAAQPISVILNIGLKTCKTCTVPVVSGKNAQFCFQCLKKKRKMSAQKI